MRTSMFGTGVLSLAIFVFHCGGNVDVSATSPNPDASAGGGAGAGGVSCTGLAATCGASGYEDCCASSVVPGGTFNRSNEVASPATISAFRLDNYEVTVGRFRKFVAAYSQAMTASGAGKNPNNAADTGWDTAWNASLPATAAALTGTSGVQCNSTYQTWTDSAGANDNRPINCVNWYEAYAFCIWDGGRLATEAEWNYAAAGGSPQRSYPWGAAEPQANASLAVYGCYYNGTGSCTGVTNIAPVGSVTAGNGLWGHSDLAGNLSEWVQDHYDSYPSPCNNCASKTNDSYRVCRGGYFVSSVSNLRAADRDSSSPGSHFYSNGFRCARSAP